MVKLHLLKGHSRIWIRAYINDVQKMRVMVDTGCHTTMIDVKIADKYGKLLPDGTEMKIGGKAINAKGYLIKSLSFGSLEIKNIFVWAMDCEPREELAGKILLGLNVMNNWIYTIDRNKNTMEISENIFLQAPESEYPYMHKFMDGKYVCLQDDSDSNG